MLANTSYFGHFSKARVIHGRSDPADALPLVLIIEDDRDAREMYAVSLKANGFEVAQAHNGLQGLEKARDLQPAVVVTDLAIPGIDGFEFCRRLKGDARTKDIPVIAVTGHSALMGETERAHRAGCEVVLIKPCLPDKLVAEIHRRLAQVEATRE
jgi:CheY-like chemotaxis protein